MTPWYKQDLQQTPRWIHPDTKAVLLVAACWLPGVALVCWLIWNFG